MDCVLLPRVILILVRMKITGVDMCGLTLIILFFVHYMRNTW